jgi:multicomponent Na+:H+ antiporter subunit G
MIDFALDILSWILLILGSFCVLIGGIGGLRLPF